MSNYLQEARAIEGTLVSDRRYLHRNAEVGVALPKTTAYVVKRLAELGYTPEELPGGGVTASVGKKGGKTFLLRADMDALPMQEDSGLDFQSQNDGAAHTCGHDMHTAILLGAAGLLKAREAELAGEVRLMFQPDEEGLTGATGMIDAGILAGVDAAAALHVFPGIVPPGAIYYVPGTVSASQDRFLIQVEGRGGHGAMPHLGVDPIHVGAHIVLALQGLVARELDATKPVVITVGSFRGGEAANIIPQTVVLEGTIRALSPEARSLAKQRLTELCEMTAKTYRASCVVEFPVETPCNYNNPALTEELVGYMKELGIRDIGMSPSMGSEDFAYVSEQVPSVYFALASGGDAPGHGFSLHNPKVVLNEGALPVGAAALAQCATEYLRHNQ